jgi:hypothetical protein
MKKIMFQLSLAMVLALVIIPTLYAGNVEIVNAIARKDGANWHFDVTLKHADSGWDHYADAWRVVSKDGQEFGTRTLFHPHEHEQPFTRSLGDVKIPANLDTVFIEAHDKVHGWSKLRFPVKIK